MAEQIEEGAPPKSDERYECPVTGAHFGFRDMCRRSQSKYSNRLVSEDVNSNKAKTVILNT